MKDDSAPAIPWAKSTYSNTEGQCVEVADLVSCVGVRDSKNPTGPALWVTPGEWVAFTAGVRDGQLD